MGSPEAVSACLRERDANNNTVLMHALRSQASGLSRLFLAHPKGVPEQVRQALRLHGSALGPVQLRYGPLTRACGHRDVRRLLEARADPTERDTAGRSAWHLAAAEGRAPVLRRLGGPTDALRDSGARGGWTPAQLAAIGGFTTLARELEGGATEGDGGGAAGVQAAELPAPPGGWAHRPSGNWTPSSAAERYDPQRCDFSVVDCATLTAAAFLAAFWAPNRPALLAGCAADWPARQRWSRAELVERYGDVELQVGRIAFPETYGLRGTVRRLADVAAAAERHVFYRRIGY